MRGSARGLQDGEAVQGMVKGCVQGKSGPTHPGPPWWGAGRPRWACWAGAVSGGGGGRWGWGRTSGSSRPSRDHVRKPGSVGMGLEGKVGGVGGNGRENPGWGRVIREGGLPSTQAQLPPPPPPPLVGRLPHPSLGLSCKEPQAATARVREVALPELLPGLFTRSCPESMPSQTLRHRLRPASRLLPKVSILTVRQNLLPFRPFL